MSITHITYRKADGEWLPCQDIGCDDFDRAEYNRYMVANHLFCMGYYLVENALARIPYNQPLPSWILLGDLPRGDKEAQANNRVSAYSDDNHNINYDGGQKDLTDLLDGVV